MNKIILTVILGITAVGCWQPHENHAQMALDTYTSFVDSICEVNEAWKQITDTDYVEMFVNPHDLTKTKIDTILTPPSAKKSMLADAFYKVRIFDQYVPLKADADSKFSQMDSVSQQLYRRTQKKFESLLVE